MGLIINKKIPELMVGYPTVSDKYNVSGAVLVGSTSVPFGSLVKYSSTKGYFEAITSTVTLADIAGFVLATNVKLANNWPATTWAVNPGEAFNLVLGGSYLAIELDSTADDDYVLPNASAYVILATGKITTSDQASAGTIVELPGVVFTGTYEMHGDKLVAEILVK